MINLLPDNDKHEIRAARTNVVLLRYNFLLLGIAGFLLASGLVVYALLTTTKGIAESTNEANNSRAAAYSTTRVEAEEYRKNLTIAKQILNNEVIYTDLVFAITNLLPSGIVLDNLNLNSKEFGTATNLSVHAKDYAAVAALKDAFEKSSLLSDVHFQSINNISSTVPQAYPIGVTINVTINKAVKK